MTAPLDCHDFLGQVLIRQGCLTEDQLQIALQEQRRDYRLLGRLLIALGFVAETELFRALSQVLGRHHIDLRQTNINPLARQKIPLELARRHWLLAIDFSEKEQRLTLAVSDPSDIVGLDKVRALIGEEVEIDAVLAGEADIEQAIDRHYGHTLSIDDILAEIEHGTPYRKGAMLSGEDNDQPIIRLIDALFSDAIKCGASDIHFEPEAHSLRIRYRIDGMLRRIRTLHASLWPAMVVRIKVMAGMNIAETRAPQDGRISLQVSGRAIDLRTSCHPTLHGENIVLRILDRARGIVPLASLGLDNEQEQNLHRMLARPTGIFLVTGPTGSGKTTTLYSLLKHIDHEGIHIMTLEDPVEYPMERVRQTSIAETSKLDFASGIRSMLRQDPDIILVGEIRDAETADMAFRAAMTGHQVFSTLHANSALGAIPRLLDLGVSPQIMSGNLIGILAQRLVRRLCPSCRQARAVTPPENALFVQAQITPPAQIFVPGSCADCEHQGYRGRLAIIEALRITPSLDELLAGQANTGELLASAQAAGFTTLACEGLRQVAFGTTSLDEITRVLDLTTATDHALSL